MNVIDRLVNYMSPEAGLRRKQARIAAGAMDTFERYAAAVPSRLRDDRQVSTTGENATLAKRLPALRAMATQQVRDNPLALRIIDLWTMHIIGDGMKTEFMSTDGVSKSVAKRHNKEFEQWAESTLCDVEGLNNLYGVQGNGAWLWGEKGEFFVRKIVLDRNHPLVKAGKIRVPLQIKILEPEFLDHNKNGINSQTGDPIVMGIQFDKNYPDVRVGYWMFPEHPGENPKLLNYKMESVFVPADEIAHIFLKTRNNVRGVTWLHAVLDHLRDLEEYLAALKMKAKVEACYTILIHQSAGYQAPPNTKRGSNDEPLEEIAPGMIRRLKPGEDAKAFDPGNSSGHTALLSTLIHMIAIGTALTYDQAYSDLTGANYSSLRAGKLEFNRQKSRRQWIFEQMFQQVVCRWFVEIGQLAQLWPSDKFLASVTPAPSDFVDPKKDGDAEVQDMGYGLVTWSELVNKRGKNPARHAEDLKNDFELFETVLGIEHPFKLAMAKLGQKPANTNTPPDDDPEEKEAA